MFRDSLFAVFRRRNSARNLNNAKSGKEQDPKEEPRSEKALAETVEETREKATTPTVPSTNSLDKLVEKNKVDLVEETRRPISVDDGPAEAQERQTFLLKANPIFEESSSELQPSDGCEGSVTGDFTEGTDVVGKEDGLLPGEAVEKPKALAGRGLGWTPGRVRCLESKNRYVLEPVVALTDSLDEVCLDENLIRAISGKRGSFSSEISQRTDESEGSEAKRVRLWSVFRARGGDGPAERC